MDECATEPGAIPSALDRRYVVAFDTAALEQRASDVLVLGSGIAGMTAALGSCRDHDVALVTKGTLTETATWYAQGGIAGAVGEADSVELHVADTLVVGQGLCDEEVVRAVIAEAPAALAELQELGVHFDTLVGGDIALAREGGHSLPRVLHSGDATGAAVQNALTASVRAQPAVGVFERHFLVDLLTEGERCIGALLLDLDRDALVAHYAGAVVLATGGAGQLFAVTTNPAIATGDGAAAAYRAGADVSDLEFVQFHPTALDSSATPRFLITEALRGEGAYLLDCDEERFMVPAHPLAELAPRDIVSREMERVMERCERDNVWLDARHLGEEFLRVRFPTIWRACADAGFDLARDLVPVAPAAHYAIGGVAVDLDGRSSIPGLFATGEVAASGLHGANRLASNSLLEGVVVSRRIARVLECETEPAGTGLTRKADLSAAGGGGEPACGALERTSLQLTMSRYVGATRDAAGLESAVRTLDPLASCVDRASRTRESIEVANMATLALLTAHAAWLREESRGTHWRIDFPERDDDRWLARIAWRREHGWRRIPVAVADAGRAAEPSPSTGM